MTRSDTAREKRTTSAPSPKDLSLILTARKQPVLERWRALVREDARIPSAKRLEDPRLLDHIPVFIDELVEELSHRGEKPEALPKRRYDQGRAAREHAQCRAWQGYAVPEALTELGLLRRALVEELTAAAPHCGPLLVIHDAIDHATVTVAGCIVRAREEEQRQRTRSENRLTLILECVKDYGIFSLSPDNKIISWSQGAADITQFTEEEAIGQTGELIFTPEDRANAVCRHELEKAANEGRVEDKRWHMRKDGTRFWAMGFTTAIRTEAGELSEFVKIFRDETERKQVEEEREKMLEELARANKMKDLFLATLSHELRTPLGVIGGFVDLLRVTPQAEDPALYAEALEVIERNVKLQTKIVEDLLEISRFIAGKLTLELRPIPIGDVVEAAVVSQRLAAKAKHVSLTYQCNDVGFVRGDARRLQQVVLNLLTNALKFTPEGGTIAVRLAKEQQGVRLSVTDSGRGMRPEVAPYVFDLYKQADDFENRQLGGLGLGLALVKQIVELHDGTVSATSEGEGKGATFCVTLPRMARP